MATANDTTTSMAAFDATATFEPSLGRYVIQLTGTDTNPANIANIVLYANGEQIGSTGQINATAWSSVVDLPGAGIYKISAKLYTFSGVSSFSAPFNLVIADSNQPYVYQEQGINKNGVIARISNFDSSGQLIGQTAIAGNGSGPAPFSVAFDSTAQYQGSTEALLTGTSAAAGNASSIEIFDGRAISVIDPSSGGVLGSAKALGLATINSDGSWSFDAHVSPGQHRFTAVATSFSGQTASSQSSYDLLTGIVGKPYAYEEIDHNSDGTVAATTARDSNGDVQAQSAVGGVMVQGGFSTGQVLTSSYDDVMTGDGTGSTTFVFKRGFGQDEITNFDVLNAMTNPTGLEHDVISLPDTSFQNFAQVMRHTTTALDGDAVIHLNSHDSIKIDGVTKADLITHPNVVRFHS